MVKLIVHAGFPKCGSTSIFSALKLRLDLLVKNDIRVFNRAFNLPREQARLNPPLWELQKASQDAELGAQVRERIVNKLETARRGTRLILSSENLSQPAMARMLSGLDRLCDIELVFYFRPQVDWIPSAWKQWNLKDGFTLAETIENYVDEHRPDYLQSVEVWKQTNPQIKITPRPFLRTWMTRGQPAYDFFDLLGLSVDPDPAFEERSNPSVDYALMYMMQRNSKRIFKDRHDNKGLHTMLTQLPPAYRKTNMQMVSQAQADLVFEAFYDDNMSILQDYMGMGYEQARSFLKQNFHKTVTGDAYSDIPEADLIQRATRILQEVTGKSRDPDGLLLELMGGTSQIAPTR